VTSRRYHSGNRIREIANKGSTPGPIPISKLRVSVAVGLLVLAALGCGAMAALYMSGLDYPT
jgi:hypothetical protein